MPRDQFIDELVGAYVQASAWIVDDLLSKPESGAAGKTQMFLKSCSYFMG